MHVTNLGSIPSLLYDPLSTVMSDSCVQRQEQTQSIAKWGLKTKLEQWWGGGNGHGTGLEYSRQAVCFEQDYSEFDFWYPLCPSPTTSQLSKARTQGKVQKPKKKPQKDEWIPSVNIRQETTGAGTWFSWSTRVLMGKAPGLIPTIAWPEHPPTAALPCADHKSH